MEALPEDWVFSVDRPLRRRAFGVGSGDIKTPRVEEERSSDWPVKCVESLKTHAPRGEVRLQAKLDVRDGPLGGVTEGMGVDGGQRGPPSPAGVAGQARSFA